MEQIGEHTVDENQASHCRRKKKKEMEQARQNKLCGAGRELELSVWIHVLMCVCVFMCVHRNKYRCVRMI